MTTKADPHALREDLQQLSPPGRDRMLMLPLREAIAEAFKVALRFKDSSGAGAGSGTSLAPLNERKRAVSPAVMAPRKRMQQERRESSICSGLRALPGSFPRDATSGAETEQSPTLPPEAIASPPAPHAACDPMPVSSHDDATGDTDTVRQDPTYVYRRGSSEGSEDEETEEETEEGSRETALRRSYARNVLRQQTNKTGLILRYFQRLQENCLVKKKEPAPIKALALLSISRQSDFSHQFKQTISHDEDAQGINM
ncbi:hypothetical protein HBH98_246010 [Parastagonospora nodorum]|nr:hypothetical protein HBH98_246010 [Parastagonospora nodorum]KAH4355091.1 hypothetical protein HBH97_240160 [Parastagonospora nodorum]KAH5088844.1 hypothetical protein HBH72_240090 [Parastagonospora nodorum]KAH5097553.1 hypothetical protein HBH71_246100 [Parastagonospora nodorum]KAH5703785.1 hypothetical protein HBI20_243020 [Parastagonospora nodorum]